MAKKTNLPANQKHYIIGVGASASGTEALHELFDHMPPDSGCSFVVIQHLSPDHKSMPGELLAKHTLMPVSEAKQGITAEPNHIYVIPNDQLITVQGNVLQLDENHKTKLPNFAIDIFFASLAAEKKADAIGIVLCGPGADGTRGVEEIKHAGGIVIVQDPGSAAFDGMPNSAAATGLADLILPPELMGEELVEFISDDPLVRSVRNAIQRDEALLREILAMLHAQSGHDFSGYKRPTLFRRIAKRMAEQSISSLGNYLQMIHSNPEELNALGKELLINVTRFFRDGDAFDLLQQKVIPQLFSYKNKEQAIKIWSLACSSGEEAYSLAMLVQEYLQQHPCEAQIKIFATDIDSDALEIASHGMYAHTITKDVPQRFLDKYFVREEGGYRIIPSIRKMVVFANHNILKDPPFSKVDLICCRNMLIYMDSNLQNRVLHKIYFALNLHGYLLLGSSEHAGTIKAAFQEMSRKWKLYKCISKTVATDMETFLSPLDKAVFPAPAASRQKNPMQNLSDCLRETLLEDRNIAGILVDKEFNVKQATGNFRDFLTFPEQQFNLSVLKLVVPDLSVALGAGLRKALTNDEPVVLRRVAVHSPAEKKFINVIIRPYLDTTNYAQQYLFIVLEEEKTETKDVRCITELSITSAHRIEELENELKDSRENLQAVIEELESTNEEMQSANEEMISTNEELQSTNEELQTLNEELHTVSMEHQNKIKELVELNDDLDNYFRNSNIGQLFIDQNLIIRKFSPGVSAVINVIQSDLSRSILDITNNFKNGDLVTDVRMAIASGTPMEKEIVLKNDAHYIMRINPYLKCNRRDGIVINFIDVSESKKLSGIIEAVFNISSSGITAKRTIRNSSNEIIDFEYLIVNESYKKLYDLSGDIIGSSMKEVLANPKQEYIRHCISVVETGKTVRTETYYEHTDRWIETTIVKMYDGIVSTHTDITEKKKAEQRLAESYEELKKTSRLLSDSNVQLERSNFDLMQFASVASHDLKEPLRKIQAFGNLLQSKIEENLQVEEKGYLQKMISTSGRMQVLIEDVLTLSKLSNNHLPHGRVNLAAVIKYITDDLEIIIAEKKAKITTAQLPEVYAVQGQMHQLFQNLIINALKFNDKASPEIFITGGAAQPEMVKEMGGNKKSQYVCIQVKDNGIGFEPEYKERIFGLFQRLNGRLYDGTGIGLAIAKKIIENHNGFIKADSVINEGTVFTILLPKE